MPMEKIINIFIFLFALFNFSLYILAIAFIIFNVVYSMATYSIKDKINAINKANKKTKSKK